MVLPIKQDDIYMGLAEINGLIRAEENALEIEYKVKDDVFGMFDSKIKSCRIPFRFIDSIEVEQKWMSGRFHIYLNRLPDLDTAFRLTENCITFKFKNKEIGKAKSIRSRLMLEISEQKLRDLEEEMDRPKVRKTDQAGTNSDSDKQKKRVRDIPEREAEKPAVLKNMLRNK
jgi:hypothetical protein